MRQDTESKGKYASQFFNNPISALPPDACSVLQHVGRGFGG